MCKLDNLFRAVSEGNLKLVIEILSTQNIIHQDWKDYELLLLALRQNQKEIAKILLDHGCRVQDASKKDFIDTPIFYVIEMQDSEMIQLILDKNFSFNSIDHKFQSPFESIIKLNDREVVTKILSAYVNEKINPVDDAGFCPFLIACYFGDTSTVKYFLNIDPSIINRRVEDSARNFPGFSSLHFAAQNGDSEMIEILLSHGADITLKDKGGISAFHLACVNKNEQIRDLLMKILFERNAHCVQDEGFSLVFKSLMYKHMIKLNRKYEESDVTWDSWTPLHYAVTLRKSELVELLLKKNANVDAKDDNGLTPLHLACQCAFEELSKTISTNNEGFNFEMDYTCHHIMKLKIKELFVLHHKDPLSSTELGKLEKELTVNPDVKKSMIEKRKEIIGLLLHYGAEVNVTDNIGATPLHDLLARDYFFEESDKIEIILQILNKGADVNVKTKANIVPLYLALRYSFLDVARILIDHNADIKSHMEAPIRAKQYWKLQFSEKHQQRRLQRFSPIHVLLSYANDLEKSFSVLKVLLEKGADPNARDSSDLSLLKLVLVLRKIDKEEIDRTVLILKILLEKGADPNARDSSDWSLLELVILLYQGEEEKKEVDRIFMTLFQFGAEVNSRNRNLNSPLHSACWLIHNRTASIFLNYGADINAVDDENKTPLDYAFKNFCSNHNSRSQNLFRTIKQHVIKLKHIGLYVSQQNEECLRNYEELCPDYFTIVEFENFSKQCAEEIDRLKNTKINKYTTLYGALFKEELNDLAAYVNDTFKEIVESNEFGDKFKLYGYLLKLKYEKSLKKKLLVEEAEKALKFFTKREIPDLCIRMILSNLNKESLQVLTKAYETNVNDA